MSLNLFFIVSMQLFSNLNLCLKFQKSCFREMSKIDEMSKDAFHSRELYDKLLSFQHFNL